MEFMTPGVVGERVARVAEVRADTCAAKPAITVALIAARQIRAWVDAQEAGLIGQLATVDSFPEATIAKASKGSLGQASKAKERADTLAATPLLAGALENGAITAGHIDALTRSSKQLEPAQREQLLGIIDGLANVADEESVAQFRSRVDLEANKLQSDHGEDRLSRQKKNTRLSTWVANNGMWNLRATFDPETGVRLSTALNTTVQALFGEAVPEHCPSDPIEKQKFLAAHALARLIEGTASTTKPEQTGGSEQTGKPEQTGGSEQTGNPEQAGNPERTGIVVAIDADAPDKHGPVAQWSIPVELPPRVLAELARTADITAVVIRNGIVLHAPGNLNLGQSTRLANRAQRRALRGLYRCCAIPGCTVGFDHCKIHHVVWWRHGGNTDLANLLPVCSKHHTNIHHHNWIIELGPNQQLTVRLPDRTIHNTDPPTIRAA
jgi:hypothetical protein